MSSPTRRRTIRFAVALIVSITVPAAILWGTFISSAFETPQTAQAIVPVISATMVDAISTDADGDGRADPGDTLQYTVTINNTGPDPALNTIFTDTLPLSLTLVPGSVTASPIGVNDSYTATGNIRITKDAASGVLANDIDPNTGNNTGLTASAGATSTNGGNVTMNADGSFVYNPAPGFEGTDTFNYTVTDPGGATGTGTVTFTVSGMIWFVQAGAPAGGNGRLSNPFNCLIGAGCFDPAAADDLNDNIFIYSGSYTGGITLLNNQRLIGQGATASISTITGITPPAGSDALPSTGGARPIITTSAASTNGVTLGSGNTLRGFNIGNTTAADISGTGIGTLTVSEMDLNGTGRPLNLTNGTLAATFDSLTATSAPGGAGISLTTIGGTLTVNGTTSISGAATQGISISGSSLGANFGTSTTIGSTTQGILVGTSTGNASFGNTAITAGTDGVSLQSNPGGTRSFGTLSTTNGSGVGLLNANGGAVTVTGQATFTNPGGRCIDVQNNATAVTFANVNATQCGGTGVFFNSNSSLITFADLDISPDTGQRSFHATNNTGAITATSGTITSTNQTSVEIVGTSAASRTPLNVQFTSVSASGGLSGIILTNTSSSGAPGGFRVLGDGNTSQGGNNSGGTLQNQTGSAISLTNVDTPVFNNLNIQSAANHGILGTGVANFAFSNGKINNVGDASAESCLSFSTLNAVNATGTFAFTNSQCTLVEAEGVDLKNYGGTLSDVSISNNVFTDTGDVATPGSAVLLVANSTASVSAVVTKATFNNNNITDFRAGAGFVLQGVSVAGSLPVTYGTPGSPTNVIAVTGNLMNGGSGGIGNQPDRFVTGGVYGNGQGNMNVSNNGTAANRIRNIDCIGIELQADAPATLTTTVQNNFLNLNSAVGCAGMAIGTDDPVANGAATHTTTVSNNNVQGSDGPGIFVIVRDSTGTMNATVTGNTAAAPIATNAARAGIRVDSGSSAGDTTLCLDLRTNTTAGSTNSGTGTTSPGINLRKQTTDPAVNAFGIEGMVATSSPGVENYVNGLNTSTSGTFGVAGTALLSATSGFTNCSSAPRPQQIDEELVSAVTPEQEEQFERLVADSAELSNRSQVVEEPLPIMPPRMPEDPDAPSFVPPFIITGQPAQEISASPSEIASRLTEIAYANAEIWPDFFKAKREFVETPSANIEKVIADTATPSATVGRSSGLGEMTSAFFEKLGEMISPTAHSQEVKENDAANEPAAGETITVNGSGTGFTIPSNKSTTITFRAVIGSPQPALTQVSNQGSVAGNFTTVLTDDPDVAGTANPTVTNIDHTTVAIASSVNPSVFGQNVTFTATMTGVPTRASDPPGTVQFKADGTNIGSPVPVVIGTANDNVSTAQASIATLAVGTRVITAEYSGGGTGSTGYNANTGTLTGGQVVGRANSATALTSSQNPSVFGQPVTFTATVTPVAPGSGSPTGTVNFLDGGNPITGCQNVTLQSGQAQCQPGSLSVGNHTITTTYSGDTNFNTSTGNMTGNPQVVNRANTAVGLTSSQNPAPQGTNITFTATLSVTAPGAGTPSGTVQFRDGATPITGCTAVTVTGNSAACQTNTLTVGNHTISAVYSGDTNFNTSTGNLTGNPQVITGPPVITPAVGLTRVRSNPASNSQIATVSDDVSNPGAIAVTVLNAPAGITVANIVNTNGTITANITAACAAADGNNTVVLRATDGKNLTQDANVIVNVQPNPAPTLGTYANQTIVTSCKLFVTPSAAPADNVPLTSVTATSPTFGGTLVVDQTTGLVTASNSGPVPGPHTVTVTATDTCGVTATRNFTITVTNPPTAAADFDFDGDRKSDISVYRAGATATTQSAWFILRSTDNTFLGFNFGLGEDRIVPGDYTGDGRTDLAVYRPSERIWYYSNNLTNPETDYTIVPWGQSGDITVPGKYDADNKMDIAIFRPASGAWFILRSTGGSEVRFWGTSGDKVVPADYDGDGRTDLAVWRTGNWYVQNSSNGSSTITNWGLGTDRLVPADYDGDGRDDIAVYRPSDQFWYIVQSTGGTRFEKWGQAADLPVPADYDNDGKADLAIYRPSGGTWHVFNSCPCVASIAPFGIATDQPIPTAYIP